MSQCDVCRNQSNQVHVSFTFIVSAVFQQLVAGHKKGMLSYGTLKKIFKKHISKSDIRPSYQ